jgi:Terminase large subunit, T4likevirus-type, N-terminal
MNPPPKTPHHKTPARRKPTAATKARDSHVLLDALLALPEEERFAELAILSEQEQKELSAHWELWARRSQLPPPGDWRTWLIMAGRGFGKTRAGSEWVRACADANPQARIALIGATLVEARAVMVEGESGLLAICPPDRQPKYEPSLRRLTWPNGAQATLYSAQEPESLRGPQHSHACRTGPEGDLRQRSARPHRCRAALRGGRHPSVAAGQPSGRAVLAGRGIARRRLGRTGRQHRKPPGRTMAVHRPARRIESARPGHRTGKALSRRLARPRRPGKSDRWIDHRCGGAIGPCRPDCPTAAGRGLPQHLSRVHAPPKLAAALSLSGIISAMQTAENAAFLQQLTRLMACTAVVKAIDSPPLGGSNFSKRG